VPVCREKALLAGYPLTIKIAIEGPNPPDRRLRMFEELRKYPIDPDQPRRRRILQAALTPEEYAFLERLRGAP